LSTAPFVERHRPENLEEIVLPQEIKDRLRAFAITGDFPQSCILWGEPGLGKTTSALADVKEYYVRRGIYAPDTTLEEIRANNPRLLKGVFVPSLFVASRTQGTIDFIRGKFTVFLQGLFSSLIKLVIFDEADAMSKDAQEALLPLIERFSSTRIIFTTNMEPVFGLGPAIVSRAGGCTFEFTKPSKEEVKAHLKKLAEKEGVKLSEDAFDSIVDVAKDVREAVGMLGSDIALVRVKEVPKEEKKIPLVPLPLKPAPSTPQPPSTTEKPIVPTRHAPLTDEQEAELVDVFKSEMALRNIPLKTSAADYLATFRALVREWRNVPFDRIKNQRIPNLIGAIVEGREEARPGRTGREELARRIQRAEAKFHKDDVIEHEGNLRRVLEVNEIDATGNYAYRLEGVEDAIDESLLKKANIPAARFNVEDNVVYRGKGFLVLDRIFDISDRAWRYRLKEVT